MAETSSSKEESIENLLVKALEGILDTSLDGKYNSILPDVDIDAVVTVSLGTDEQPSNGELVDHAGKGSESIEVANNGQLSENLPYNFEEPTRIEKNNALEVPVNYGNSDNVHIADEVTRSVSSGIAEDTILEKEEETGFDHVTIPQCNKSNPELTEYDSSKVNAIVHTPEKHSSMMFTHNSENPTPQNTSVHADFGSEEEIAIFENYEFLNNSETFYSSETFNADYCIEEEPLTEITIGFDDSQEHKSENSPSLILQCDSSSTSPILGRGSLKSFYENNAQFLSIEELCNKDKELEETSPNKKTDVNNDMPSLVAATEITPNCQHDSPPVLQPEVPVSVSLNCTAQDVTSIDNEKVDGDGFNQNTELSPQGVLDNSSENQDCLGLSPGTCATEMINPTSNRTIASQKYSNDILSNRVDISLNGSDKCTGKLQESMSACIIDQTEKCKNIDNTCNDYKQYNNGVKATLPSMPIISFDEEELHEVPKSEGRVLRSHVTRNKQKSFNEIKSKIKDDDKIKDRFLDKRRNGCAKSSTEITLSNSTILEHLKQSNTLDEHDYSAKLHNPFKLKKTTLVAPNNRGKKCDDACKDINFDCFSDKKSCEPEDIKQPLYPKSFPNVHTSGIIVVERVHDPSLKNNKLPDLNITHSLDGELKCSKNLGGIGSDLSNSVSVVLNDCEKEDTSMIASKIVPEHGYAASKSVCSKDRSGRVEFVSKFSVNESTQHTHIHNSLDPIDNIFHQFHESHSLQGHDLGGLVISDHSRNGPIISPHPSCSSHCTCNLCRLPSNSTNLPLHLPSVSAPFRESSSSSSTLLHKDHLYSQREHSPPDSLHKTIRRLSAQNVSIRPTSTLPLEIIEDHPADHSIATVDIDALVPEITLTELDDESDTISEPHKAIISSDSGFSSTSSTDSVPNSTFNYPSQDIICNVEQAPTDVVQKSMHDTGAASYLSAGNTSLGIVEKLSTNEHRRCLKNVEFSSQLLTEDVSSTSNADTLLLSNDDPATDTHNVFKNSTVLKNTLDMKDTPLSSAEYLTTGRPRLRAESTVTPDILITKNDSNDVDHALQLKNVHRISQPSTESVSSTTNINFDSIPIVENNEKTPVLKLDNVKAVPLLSDDSLSSTSNVDSPTESSVGNTEVSVEIKITKDPSGIISSDFNGTSQASTEKVTSTSNMDVLSISAVSIRSDKGMDDTIALKNVESTSQLSSENVTSTSTIEALTVIQTVKTINPETDKASSEKPLENSISTKAAALKRDNGVRSDIHCTEEVSDHITPAIVVNTTSDIGSAEEVSADVEYMFDKNNDDPHSQISTENLTSTFCKCTPPETYIDTISDKIITEEVTADVEQMLNLENLKASPQILTENHSQEISQEFSTKSTLISPQDHCEKAPKSGVNIISDIVIGEKTDVAVKLDLDKVNVSSQMLTENCISRCTEETILKASVNLEDIDASQLLTENRPLTCIDDPKKSIENQKLKVKSPPKVSACIEPKKLEVSEMLIENLPSNFSKDLKPGIDKVTNKSITELVSNNLGQGLVLRNVKASLQMKIEGLTSTCSQQLPPTKNNIGVISDIESTEEVLPDVEETLDLEKVSQRLSENVPSSCCKDVHLKFDIDTEQNKSSIEVVSADPGQNVYCGNVKDSPQIKAENTCSKSILQKTDVNIVSNIESTALVFAVREQEDLGNVEASSQILPGNLKSTFDKQEFIKTDINNVSDTGCTVKVSAQIKQAIDCDKIQVPSHMSITNLNSSGTKDISLKSDDTILDKGSAEEILAARETASAFEHLESSQIMTNKHAPTKFGITVSDISSAVKVSTVVQQNVKEGFSLKNKNEYEENLESTVQLGSPDCKLSSESSHDLIPNTCVPTTSTSEQASVCTLIVEDADDAEKKVSLKNNVIDKEIPIVAKNSQNGEKIFENQVNSVKEKKSVINNTKKLCNNKLVLNKKMLEKKRISAVPSCVIIEEMQKEIINEKENCKNSVLEEKMRSNKESAKFTDAALDINEKSVTREDDGARYDDTKPRYNLRDKPAYVPPLQMRQWRAKKAVNQTDRKSLMCLKKRTNLKSSHNSSAHVANKGTNNKIYSKRNKGNLEEQVIFNDLIENNSNIGGLHCVSPRSKMKKSILSRVNKCSVLPNGINMFNDLHHSSHSDNYSEHSDTFKNTKEFSTISEKLRNRNNKVPLISAPTSDTIPIVEKGVDLKICNDQDDATTADFLVPHAKRKNNRRINSLKKISKLKKPKKKRKLTKRVTRSSLPDFNDSSSKVDSSESPIDVSELPDVISNSAEVQSVNDLSSEQSVLNCRVRPSVLVLPPETYNHETTVASVSRVVKSNEKPIKVLEDVSKEAASKLPSSWKTDKRKQVTPVKLKVKNDSTSAMHADISTSISEMTMINNNSYSGKNVNHNNPRTYLNFDLQDNFSTSGKQNKVLLSSESVPKKSENVSKSSERFETKSNKCMYPKDIYSAVKTNTVLEDESSHIGEKSMQDVTNRSEKRVSPDLPNGKKQFIGDVSSNAELKKSQITPATTETRSSVLVLNNTTPEASTEKFSENTNTDDSSIKSPLTLVAPFTTEDKYFGETPTDVDVMDYIKSLHLANTTPKLRNKLERKFCLPLTTNHDIKNSVLNESVLYKQHKPLENSCETHSAVNIEKRPSVLVTPEPSVSVSPETDNSQLDCQSSTDPKSKQQNAEIFAEKSQLSPPIGKKSAVSYSYPLDSLSSDNDEVFPKDIVFSENIINILQQKKTHKGLNIDVNQCINSQTFTTAPVVSERKHLRSRVSGNYNSRKYPKRYRSSTSQKKLNHQSDIRKSPCLKISETNDQILEKTKHEKCIKKTPEIVSVKFEHGHTLMSDIGVSENLNSLNNEAASIENSTKQLINLNRISKVPKLTPEVIPLDSLLKPLSPTIIGECASKDISIISKQVSVENLSETRKEIKSKGKYSSQPQESRSSCDFPKEISLASRKHSETLIDIKLPSKKRILGSLSKALKQSQKPEEKVSEPQIPAEKRNGVLPKNHSLDCKQFSPSDIRTSEHLKSVIDTTIILHNHHSSHGVVPEYSKGHSQIVSLDTSHKVASSSNSCESEHHNILTDKVDPSKLGSSVNASASAKKTYPHNTRQTGNQKSKVKGSEEFLDNSPKKVTSSPCIGTYKNLKISRNNKKPLNCLAKPVKQTGPLLNAAEKLNSTINSDLSKVAEGPILNDITETLKVSEGFENLKTPSDKIIPRIQKSLVKVLPLRKRKSSKLTHKIAKDKHTVTKQRHQNNLSVSLKSNQDLSDMAINTSRNDKPPPVSINPLFELKEKCSVNNVSETATTSELLKSEIAENIASTGKDNKEPPVIPVDLTPNEVSSIQIGVPENLETQLVEEKTLEQVSSDDMTDVRIDIGSPKTNVSGNDVTAESNSEEPLNAISIDTSPNEDNNLKIELPGNLETCNNEKSFEKESPIDMTEPGIDIDLPKTNISESIDSNVTVSEDLPRVIPVDLSPNEVSSIQIGDSENLETQVVEEKTIGQVTSNDMTDVRIDIESPKTNVSGNDVTAESNSEEPLNAISIDTSPNEDNNLKIEFPANLETCNNEKSFEKESPIDMTEPGINIDLSKTNISKSIDSNVTVSEDLPRVIPVDLSPNEVSSIQIGDSENLETQVVEEKTLEQVSSDDMTDVRIDIESPKTNVSGNDVTAESNSEEPLNAISIDTSPNEDNSLKIELPANLETCNNEKSFEKECPIDMTEPGIDIHLPKTNISESIDSNVTVSEDLPTVIPVDLSLNEVSSIQIGDSENLETQVVEEKTIGQVTSNDMTDVRIDIESPKTNVSENNDTAVSNSEEPLNVISIDTSPNEDTCLDIELPENLENCNDEKSFNKESPIDLTEAGIDIELSKTNISENIGSNVKGSEDLPKIIPVNLSPNEVSPIQIRVAENSETQVDLKQVSSDDMTDVQIDIESPKTNLLKNNDITVNKSEEPLNVISIDTSPNEDTCLDLELPENRDTFNDEQSFEKESPIDLTESGIDIELPKTNISENIGSHVEGSEDPPKVILDDLSLNKVHSIQIRVSENLKIQVEEEKPLEQVSSDDMTDVRIDIESPKTNVSGNDVTAVSNSEEPLNAISIDTSLNEDTCLDIKLPENLESSNDEKSFEKESPIDLIEPGIDIKSSKTNISENIDSNISEEPSEIISINTSHDEVISLEMKMSENLNDKVEDEKPLEKVSRNDLTGFPIDIETPKIHLSENIDSNDEVSDGPLEVVSIDTLQNEVTSLEIVESTDVSENIGSDIKDSEMPSENISGDSSGNDVTSLEIRESESLETLVEKSSPNYLTEVALESGSSKTTIPENLDSAVSNSEEPLMVISVDTSANEVSSLKIGVPNNLETLAENKKSFEHDTPNNLTVGTSNIESTETTFLENIYSVKGNDEPSEVISINASQNKVTSLEIGVSEKLKAEVGEEKSIEQVSPNDLTEVQIDIEPETNLSENLDCNVKVSEEPLEILSIDASQKATSLKIRVSDNLESQIGEGKLFDRNPPSSLTEVALDIKLPETCILENIGSNIKCSVEPLEIISIDTSSNETIFSKIEVSKNLETLVEEEKSLKQDTLNNLTVVALESGSPKTTVSVYIDSEINKCEEPFKVISIDDSPNKPTLEIGVPVNLEFHDKEEKHFEQDAPNNLLKITVGIKSPKPNVSENIVLNEKGSEEPSKVNSIDTPPNEAACLKTEVTDNLETLIDKRRTSSFEGEVSNNLNTLVQYEIPKQNPSANLSEAVSGTEPPYTKDSINFKCTSKGSDVISLNTSTNEVTSWAVGEYKKLETPFEGEKFCEQGSPINFSEAASETVPPHSPVSENSNTTVKCNKTTPEIISLDTLPIEERESPSINISDNLISKAKGSEAPPKVIHCNIVPRDGTSVYLSIPKTLETVSETETSLKSVKDAVKKCEPPNLENVCKTSSDGNTISNINSDFDLDEIDTSFRSAFNYNSKQYRGKFLRYPRKKKKLQINVNEHWSGDKSMRSRSSDPINSKAKLIKRSGSCGFRLPDYPKTLNKEEVILHKSYGIRSQKETTNNKSNNKVKNGDTKLQPSVPLSTTSTNVPIEKRCLRTINIELNLPDPREIPNQTQEKQQKTTRKRKIHTPDPEGLIKKKVCQKNSSSKIDKSKKNINSKNKGLLSNEPKFDPEKSVFTKSSKNQGNKNRSHARQDNDNSAINPSVSSPSVAQTKPITISIKEADLIKYVCKNMESYGVNTLYLPSANANLLFPNDDIPYTCVGDYVSIHSKDLQCEENVQKQNKRPLESSSDEEEEQDHVLQKGISAKRQARRKTKKSKPSFEDINSPDPYITEIPLTDPCQSSISLEELPGNSSYSTEKLNFRKTKKSKRPLQNNSSTNHVSEHKNVNTTNPYNEKFNQTYRENIKFDEDDDSSDGFLGFLPCIGHGATMASNLLEDGYCNCTKNGTSTLFSDNYELKLKLLKSKSSSSRPESESIGPSHQDNGDSHGESSVGDKRSNFSPTSKNRKSRLHFTPQTVTRLKGNKGVNRRRRHAEFLCHHGFSKCTDECKKLLMPESDWISWARSRRLPQVPPPSATWPFTESALPETSLLELPSSSGPEIPAESDRSSSPEPILDPPPQNINQPGPSGLNRNQNLVTPPPDPFECTGRANCTCPDCDEDEGL